MSGTVEGEGKFILTTEEDFFGDMVGQMY